MSGMYQKTILKLNFKIKFDFFKKIIYTYVEIYKTNWVKK